MWEELPSSTGHLCVRLIYKLPYIKIMSLLAYKFRVYPSGKQKIRIINQFKICKEIYNTLLDLNKKLLVTNKFQLNSLVMDIKATCPEYYSQVHSQALQNVSDRLSKTFDSFFRRIKEGAKEKGFPRFKSKIMSITYPQSGFKFLSKGHLQVSKIGNLPIILHRIPKGKIKTLTIKVNNADQWFAVFSCELLDVEVKHPSAEKVGIDVGIENFATLSNGEIISNPHFLLKAEKKIKLLQRRLSRKVKGSSNRRKARFRLAKQHLKVSNIRTDWLHKLTKSLTLQYGTIAVEDLNIKGMVHNHHLAKSITDASWGIFANMLSYKEVILGGQLVKVNPRGTSMTCSKCGHIQEMPLAMREFLCLKCGFACHRDENASHNILVRADCPELNAFGHDVRPTSLAVVDEAGTTYGK